LQDHFKGLLYSNDQEQFDTHIDDIKRQLVAYPRHMIYLQREVLGHQTNFAAHHLRAVKGKFLLFRLQFGCTTGFVIGYPESH
jgi:hypothetical protein